MAVVRNTFQGTNGATITSASLGLTNPDVWVGTATYDNTAGRSPHGTTTAKVTSLNTGYISYDTNTATVSFQEYLYVPTNPTGDTFMIRLYNASSANIAILKWISTGALRLTDSAGTTRWTSSAIAPTATRIRVDGYVNITTNRFRVTWSLLDGSATQDSTEITTGVFGGANIRKVQMGKVTGGTIAGDVNIGEVAYDVATASLIPPPANAPPTVTVTANQNVAASATVNLTAVPDDVDGTIASTVWTYLYPTSGAPALTGGSTTTPSFTAGAAGSLYVLRCTVTDDDAATGYADTEVRVPVSAATEITPIAAYGGTGATVTNTGGAASEEAALADVSDATYILFAAATGTEAERRWRLKPSVARTSMVWTARVSTDVLGTFTGKVRIYEGTTLKKEWTLTTPTTSFADQTLALTSGESAAISDWGNLWVAAVEST